MFVRVVSTCLYSLYYSLWFDIIEASVDANKPYLICPFNSLSHQTVSLSYFKGLFLYPLIKREHLEIQRETKIIQRFQQRYQ